ncbi:MAG: thiamine-phosphate kinase [Bacteroidota bacterium]
MKRTELSELGEFGLIDRIKETVLLRNTNTIRGIGDDAAVMEYGETCVLVSTDLLVEGIHFDLSYVPLRHLGYKAVVVNLSDIAAMNAIPQHITVSVALSNRFSVEAVTELYEGISLACEHYGIDLVGGDTTTSPAGLTISITAMGTAARADIAYRNTARPGDVICVTGDLGAAYLGLQVLEREKQEFLANPDMEPKLDDKEYLVGRQLKPEARTDIIYDFRDLGIVPSSMIDISDGLASDLLHLCKASGTGAAIYEAELPADDATLLTATEFNMSPTTCIMNGGEDYELLFTVSQQQYEKLRNHRDIKAIGVMRDAGEGVLLMSSAGNPYVVQAQGWNHFGDNKL